MDSKEVAVVDKAWINKLHATIRKVEPPLPPVGHQDYGGITGTLSPNSKMHILKSMHECEPITGFIDLGSGSGDMCYLVAKEFDVPVYGVESSKVVCDHVDFTQRWICEQTGIEYPDRIEFMNRDIRSMHAIPSECSHVFCFATGMQQDVLQHIVKLVREDDHVKQVNIVYRGAYRADVVALFLLGKGTADVKYHPIRMMGSFSQQPSWSIQYTR